MLSELKKTKHVVVISCSALVVVMALPVGRLSVC